MAGLTKAFIVSFILILGVVYATVTIKTENAYLYTTSSRVETFCFLSNGQPHKGKIYLPDTYDTNNTLPTIFLIDFTEQHFKLATDEFEQVIAGTKRREGLDAIVVGLDGIPDIDAEPDTFKEHYDMFKDMAHYVDENYQSGAPRTFIGKGSEGGVVLMTLFMEKAGMSLFDNFIVTDPSPLYAAAVIGLIEKDSFPKDKITKKLHLSFSTSNDRSLCMRLIDRIQTADYPWLHYATVEYTESNYENTYPRSYAEGVAFVLGE